MNPREILEASFRGALRAVDPADLLRERLGKIPAARKTVVVGAGKAAAAMAACLEEFLGDRIERGLVVVKDGCGLPLRRIECLQAGHPQPDERSAAAARRALDLLRGLSADDLAIALVSGGASSLLALPKEGSVAAWREENARLLAGGAAIGEINRVRRERLALAGGGLARAAAPAKVLSFVLSDVIGNDLATIGSGPTHLDPPQPQRVRNLLIGDNALAVGGAAQGARRFGLRVEVLPEPVQGEAREAGRAFASRLLASLPGSALIAGGETTVSLGANPGKGGRCQESALAAASALAGHADCALLFAGTDGSDGPTDAAGAFADGGTIDRAKKAGLDAAAALSRHDAYPLLDRIGDLFRCGPTRTNVADLFLGVRTSL